MPTKSNAPSNSFGSSMHGQGLTIALIVLCAVGFLVLYFKIDLEASLNAGAVATVSQQVARVESRIAMDEQKVGGTAPAANSGSAQHTLATSAAIAIQGVGACTDIYSIAEPTGGDIVRYELAYGPAGAPETQDLGTATFGPGSSFTVKLNADPSDCKISVMRLR